MYGGHGKVGGNIFLLLYVVAVLNPLVEAWGAPPRRSAWSIATTVLIVATAWFVTAMIRKHGGGGAGEPLGLLLGVVVWVGRLGIPALASRIGWSPDLPGFWPILGTTLPALVGAIVMARTSDP